MPAVPPPRHPRTQHAKQEGRRRPQTAAPPGRGGTPWGKGGRAYTARLHTVVALVFNEVIKRNRLSADEPLLKVCSGGGSPHAWRAGDGGWAAEVQGQGPREGGGCGGALMLITQSGAGGQVVCARQRTSAHLNGSRRRPGAPSCPAGWSMPASPSRLQTQVGGEGGGGGGAAWRGCFGKGGTGAPSPNEKRRGAAPVRARGCPPHPRFPTASTPPSKPPPFPPQQHTPVVK